MNNIDRTCSKHSKNWSFVEKILTISSISFLNEIHFDLNFSLQITNDFRESDRNRPKLT